MIEIEHLIKEKWLTIHVSDSHIRKFVGAKEECEQVKREWESGDFTRGVLNKRLK